MNELATYQERGISARPSTLMDKETFQQIAEIASIMASASLIPESLAYEGSGDKKKPLPPETVRANCFLVANQAVNWGMDPFAVAQCSSVVHGRLMFEGKLVSSVIEAKLGIKLVHAYGKWDPAKEACILGEDGTGDGLAIRIGEGRYQDGVAVFTGRFVDGHVGGWKTTGNNTPWRVGRNRVMLVYRGTREFARIYEPGVMLGVITEDEYDPAYNARDITPAAPTAGAGQSVINTLKAKQSQNAAGFDPDRVNKDLNSAAPPRSGEEASSGDGASAEEVEGAPTSSTSDSSVPAPEAGKGGEGADVEVGESSAPSSPDEKQWLLNVAGMLWAATNFNGDQELLKNQRVAAAAAHDPAGISKAYLEKAKSAFERCMTVVKGEVEPEEGLKIVAGIIGVEEKVLLEKSGRTE